MSKSKDLTENTPLLSSVEGTVEKGQPSEPSVSLDNTPSSMPTTKLPSQPMLSSVPSDLTTLKISEKSRVNAMLMKVALNQLEKAGLIRHFKVLSEGSTTVQKIRIEFDMSIWTDELELK